MSSIISKIKPALVSSVQWWLAELKAALPWIEHALVEPRPRAIVFCEPLSTIVILFDVDGKEISREVMESCFDQLPEAQGKQLSKLCASHDIFLSVLASEVHRLQLWLPKVSNVNVRQSVKYRLLTESPIDPDATVFDFRRMSGETGKLRETVEVAICRRSYLERLRNAARRMEIVSMHIGLFSAQDNKLSFTFELAQGARSSRARFKRNALLAAGPLIIFVSALVLCWGYANWKERALRRDIKAMAAQSAESAKLLTRHAQSRAVAQSIYLDMSKGDPTQILNDVSKILPRSAWLTEARFENDKLNLKGSGVDPTIVVKVLAATPRLAAVRLESVNSGLIGGDPARFEITATVLHEGGK